MIYSVTKLYKKLCRCRGTAHGTHL